MIEGPLSGASSSDAASAGDLIALSATVSVNTTAIATKAPTVDLTTAQADLIVHTGQIAALHSSYN